MTFDSIILAAIAAELNTVLAGGRVDKIHQPTPLDTVLTIRAGGANQNLLVSADARTPRIHTTAAKRPNPKTPPNFCMLMRKYLEGARFLAAQQIDFDRVLHITFSAYDGERITLIVEIMGKHSNVILINGTNKILGAIKPVGRSKNRYREILPGREYMPPPPQKKESPFTAECPTPDVTGEREIASWLVGRFTGISPFAAREIAKRAGGDPARTAEEFAEFIQPIRAGRFAPVVITGGGHTVGFYPFPSVQYPADEQHARTSINAVADMYYLTAVPKQAFEEVQRDLAGRLKKELEARERTLAFIAEGLKECEGAERQKQIGELILAQIAFIPREADAVELTDYYSPDASQIVVKLDPKLSPQENAEAYFKKYHKAVSGAETLAERFTDAKREEEIIRGAIASLEAAQSAEDVANIETALAGEGIKPKREEEAPDKRKPEFEGYRISRVMENGWEILIGQNSEANDYLITRVARPNDLWIHVKAAPSAHVVIRTNNKPDSVPRSVLHAAAEQAAKNSDAKHSSLVPVDYTLRKYVRKQKGAGPGKVLYQNEKTLYITPNG